MVKRTQQVKAQHLRAVIIALERDETMTSIAGHLGVSSGTVGKWARQQGYRQKPRGRTALATMARARDMFHRDWPIPEIAKLLNAQESEVISWIRQRQDPAHSDGRPVLTVTGLPSYRSRRVRNPGKKWKPRPKPKTKESDLPKISLRVPMSTRKSGTWWSIEEEAYVLEMLKTGRYTIRQIYERTRASRRRQLRVWRKYRGRVGFPPNWPERTPEEAAALWEARQEAAEDRTATELAKLESETAERKRQIAELETEQVEDEQHFKDLLVERKALSDRRKKLERQVEAAEAVLERLPEPTEMRPRVLPGSYEAIELGMPVGAVTEPKKRGRKAMPSPRGYGQYADNGRYFAVSREWADLEDSSPDELALFADYLSSKKFPARVERRGDQPKAYFESTWPAAVEKRWNQAIESGLTLLERYRKRKKQLESKKMHSPAIIRYLAGAYDAYRNPKLTAKQKEAARKKLAKIWEDTKRTDRRIMVFAMLVAERDGSPTTKGIERGLTAKILLGRASPERKLAKRKRVTEGREVRRREITAVKEEEADEVAALMEQARAKFALPAAEEEEEE